MIGGSTAGYDDTNRTTEAIKKICKLPTILFPSNAESISEVDPNFWTGVLGVIFLPINLLLAT
jgi:heptaprenylglyceryl phosphate synthase